MLPAFNQGSEFINEMQFLVLFQVDLLSPILRDVLPHETESSMKSNC